jgi:uncharacterized protein
VLLFALWHDALRRSDDDSEHGARAAKLIADLGRRQSTVVIGKSFTQLAAPLFAERLGEARTIGCCWDADRLDLGRVGIEPDPELMSTDAARRRTASRGAATVSSSQAPE